MYSKFCWYFLILFLNIKFIIAEIEQPHLIIDQRQSGKVNIHLNIKDMAIIEFGQLPDDLSNVSDDYYYDDEDLTIKPWLTNLTMNPLFQLLGNTSITNPPTPAAIYITPVKEFNNSSKPLERTTTIKYEIPSTVQSSTTVQEFHTFNEQIPVNIVSEPVLIPKIRESTRKLPAHYNKESRVYRSKAQAKCRSGARTDDNGNCRTNGPKSLFLKKIFSILRDLQTND